MPSKNAATDTSTDTPRRPVWMEISEASPSPSMATLPTNEALKLLREERIMVRNEDLTKFGVMLEELDVGWDDTIQAHRIESETRKKRDKILTRYDWGEGPCSSSATAPTMSRPPPPGPRRRATSRRPTPERVATPSPAAADPPTPPPLPLPWAQSLSAAHIPLNTRTPRSRREARQKTLHHAGSFVRY